MRLCPEPSRLCESAERCFPVEAQLVEEIARTLYHELGHYLGMDEDDLESIGLD